jgi:hypothetical protein
MAIERRPRIKRSNRVGLLTPRSLGAVRSSRTPSRPYRPIAAYIRYLTFADPYLLISPVITIEIVLFATVGGLGRAYGPALGALLLVPLGEILRGKFGSTLPGLHYFIYGIVVIGVILLTPRGLIAYFEPMSTRWRRR